MSTPQDVALIDARKGVAMFHKVNVPIIGLLLNMSHFICGSCDAPHELFGSADKFVNAADELGLDVLGEYLGALASRKRAGLTHRQGAARDECVGRRRRGAAGDGAEREDGGGRAGGDEERGREGVEVVVGKAGEHRRREGVARSVGDCSMASRLARIGRTLQRALM